MRSHHIRVEDLECGAARTSRRDFKVLLTRQKRVSAHFCSRSVAQNWPHQLAIVVNNQRNIVYHRSRPIIRQSRRLVQQACANPHYRKCADTAKIGHTSAWSLTTSSTEHVRLRACQQIPRTRTAAAPIASKCNGKMQPFATIIGSRVGRNQASSRHELPHDVTASRAPGSKHIRHRPACQSLFQTSSSSLCTFPPLRHTGVPRTAHRHVRAPNIEACHS